MTGVVHSQVPVFCDNKEVLARLAEANMLSKVAVLKANDGAGVQALRLAILGKANGIDGSLVGRKHTQAL